MPDRPRLRGLRRRRPSWWPRWAWPALLDPPRPSRGERARGALQVAAYALSGWFLVRPWLRRIGASQAELRRTYPGDELFGHAEVVTRAITIEARASEVWPWIAQMGYGRAGWYSIDLLDNLGRSSAREIVPALQGLGIGDVVPFGPRSAFRVHDIERERFLVLTYEGRAWSGSWLFWLEPIDDQRTRLVERIRSNGGGSPLAQLATVFGEAADVVMMLAHLRNLKRRAERYAEGRRSSEVG
jgi:hypothetical protein